MNSHHASELLERAAASVTPTETNPASRLAGLGRRSVRRRRRAWGTAGSVAVAVAAALVALPFGGAAPDRSGAAELPGTVVSFGGLSVAVPEGWRTSRVTTFDACVAEARTVYLAAGWDPGRALRATPGSPGDSSHTCESAGKAWMALVREGAGLAVNPNRLVVKDGQLLQVEQPNQRHIASMWAYRAFTGDIRATAALISGDEKGRERLVERVTWPAGPADPVSGGLALPKRIEHVTTDVPPNNIMVVSTAAKTLTQIQTTLAALRDPVPDGQECTLQKPGAVGISLGEVIVVLGDETCPQAISTGGGRVRIPPELGKELLDLIVVSDLAATERDAKD